ncbi:hypothetical protein AB0D62_21845 [Streptomyces massasporeus]|uniref:hypothetical protein n=1 Tax=Streptomyces massasporeus TaxID=67324 RepID=UPI0033DEF296
MAADKGAAFVLPRGATGFFQPKDGPLPEVGQRMFRAALYAAARAAEGRVGQAEEQACTRTFHTATFITGAGEHVVLCHVHHPWIAFAEGLRDSHWMADVRNSQHANGDLPAVVPPPPEPVRRERRRLVRRHDHRAVPRVALLR